MNSKSPEEDIKNLYEKRKQTYSLADHKVDCNLKTKDKIVEEILKIYEII